ncbi:MAG: ABC transporter ATP-binding protein [Anaerolineae bacterium]|nr:ABC transporter ATP-binding protein [Anaerolineae bacterium]
MTEVVQTGNKPILEIKDLQTHFFLEHGAVRAVDGVSYSIGRNETLGVVGESGCGKSVTALSIMGLIKSPPGRIVGGEMLFRSNGDDVIDLAKLDARGAEMRAIRGEKIAMIFQEPMTSLNPLHTVGGQIAETVRLHQGVGRAEAEERALAMLHRVRIGDPEQRIHEYPHQMSGGMRQRVMIAMALSCNPSLLIADEPTTALDVTVQAQILDLMRELQEDFGSSIILITHNLGVVSQMVDNVAMMYVGKIIEYSDVRSVFHNPLHPYTQGLLNSVPVFGRQGKKVLVPIKGMVPTPTDKIVGCSFAPRCPRVMEVCHTESPVYQEVEPGHWASCWLYG